MTNPQQPWPQQPQQPQQWPTPQQPQQWPTGQQAGAQRQWQQQGQSATPGQHQPQVPGQYQPQVPGQYVPGQVQWQVPAKAEPLPVQLRRYPGFWRAPRHAWWRPVVAVVLGFVAFLVSQVVAIAIAVASDAASGRVAIEDALGNLDSTTPAFFAANNVSLASLIPIAMLVTWWIIGQRPKWLSSVVGGFRWGWFGRCMAMLVPLWLLYVGIEWALMAQSDEGLGLHWNDDSLFLIITILLTTPLQAAGEEYGFRGLLNRAAASLFGNRTVGLLAGLVFSSTLFMFAHGAGDPWLNLFYFCFGAIACVMTWRTGGLEAAIAMHIVNNVLSEASLPFSDISEMFDRSAGTADAWVLVGIVVPLVGLALVEWQARRQHVVRATAPAAPQPVEPERLGQPALTV